MRRKGSILLESLLTLPLLMLLFLSVLQFAQIWTARQQLTYAAFCATRAIMAVPPAEQQAAADKAARLALAWWCLAGDPSAPLADDGTDLTRTVHVGTLTPKSGKMGTLVRGDTQVSMGGGRPREGEISIPGWGAIPGSDSANLRVSTKIVEGGASLPIAAVTVNFKMALLVPIVGQIVSWGTNRAFGSAEDSAGVYRHMRGGWSGHETVLGRGGRRISRRHARYGENGAFPFVEMEETCVLPMPYSTARFPAGGFR